MASTGGKMEIQVAAPGGEASCASAGVEIISSKISWMRN
jgi:hypothetical protein